MIDLKVCVSCFCSKRLSPRTVQSLKKLAESKYSYDLNVKASSNVEYVKNDLIDDMTTDAVKQEVSKEFTYRLIVEDGAVFTIADIDRLISRNVPVISMVKKNMRSPEFLDCGMYERNDAGDVVRILFFDSIRMTNTIHQVDWVNSQVMLIRSDVFDAIEYPWFEPFPIQLTDANGVVHKKIVGENMGFCKKLSEANIPLFVDTKMEIPHE